MFRGCIAAFSLSRAIHTLCNPRCIAWQNVLIRAPILNTCKNPTCWPHMLLISFLNPSRFGACQALGIGAHVVADMHVGAGGGVAVAQALFSRFPGKTMGAVNAETNDGTATLRRWFGPLSRVLLSMYTAAACHPPRAVCRALLVGHACGMLIGACNPI